MHEAISDSNPMVITAFGADQNVSCMQWGRQIARRPKTYILSVRCELMHPAGGMSRPNLRFISDVSMRYFIPQASLDFESSFGMLVALLDK